MMNAEQIRSRRGLTSNNNHNNGLDSPLIDSSTTNNEKESFFTPSSAPNLTSSSTSTTSTSNSTSSTNKNHTYNKLSGSKHNLNNNNSNLTFWEKLGGGLHLTKGENRVLLGLILLGAVVRFWKIDRPNSVVFDEVHFGGFANKYIQSRFFMDVHPPLAKLLITATAFFAGFKGGSFDFKEIGRDYTEAGVPYVAMRMLPATMGLALIPLAYLTLRALQTRPSTALLGSIFIMFENGLITQSRFILLDSPLIFFTALTIFFWIGFANENELSRDRSGAVGPFSKRWWVWLTMTGLSLGAVVSCKWVGLFTIATLGVLTITQLWVLLGDLRVPMPLLARHFLARSVCLIALPCCFYLGIFVIHFAILNNSGEGDGFMSSEFQHTLAGHGMEDTFADIMIGSHISIRHLNTQGGYLHSHTAAYPGGSKQQQVTLYPHRDENNIWVILNATADPLIEDPYTYKPATYVMDKAKVVLHHISTNKKLHSHDVRAPITEVDYQNEVSAYGFAGFSGDANDHFIVEIDALTTDTSDSHDAGKRLQTLRTRFRLRHVLTGCYLFSHKTKLPDWGFEQQEVTCNKNPSKDNGLWYVETNEHGALPENALKVNYRIPSFMSKFLELQGVMWKTNAGLTDRHAYDSRPSSWPLLTRGINFWVQEGRQVYLIGNPFVWWLSTLSVFLYISARGLLILRAQRGYKDFSHSTVVHYDGLCGFLLLGWFLHYFPFFLMSRQLFLHHYFPALYFAILLSACVFDLVTSALKPKIRLQVIGVLIIATVYTYYHFSPLAYAGVWTRSQCKSAQWLKNWDFSCNDFHMQKDMYDRVSETFSVNHNPFDGFMTTAPVAGGAEAGHDPFGEGKNNKAPKSDDLPSPPAAAEASPKNGEGEVKKEEVVGGEEKKPANAEATPEGGEGGGGDGVFAVPAALEATALPEDEEKEEKAEEAVPRNAEEKIEMEKNKVEEKKEEEKVVVVEEKKEGVKEEKKVDPVVVVVEEVAAKKEDSPVAEGKKE